MKQEMNQITYIKCYNNNLEMLTYNGCTGEVRIQKRKKGLVSDDFAPGFFLVHDNELLAVVPSSNGPLLLIGKARYSLVEQDITIELGDEEEGHINDFAVFLEGTEIYRTDYKRPYSGFDELNKPEDVDFFFWLYDGYHDPQFINHHTLQGIDDEVVTTHFSMLPEPMSMEESVIEEFKRRDSKAVIWGVWFYIFLPMFVAFQFTFEGVLAFVGMATALFRAVFLIRCPACGKFFFVEWVESLGVFPRICSKCHVRLKKPWPGSGKKYWWYLGLMFLFFGVSFALLYLIRIVDKTFVMQNPLIGLVIILGPQAVLLLYGFYKGYIKGLC